MCVQRGIPANQQLELFSIKQVKCCASTHLQGYIDSSKVISGQTKQNTCCEYLAKPASKRSELSLHRLLKQVGHVQ
jgi:hypothetical protein